MQEYPLLLLMMGREPQYRVREHEVRGSARARGTRQCEESSVGTSPSARARGSEGEILYKLGGDVYKRQW